MNSPSYIASELQDLVDDLQNHDCAEYCEHDTRDLTAAEKILDELLDQIDRAESLELPLVTMGAITILDLRQLKDRLEDIKGQING